MKEANSYQLRKARQIANYLLARRDESTLTSIWALMAQVPGGGWR